MNNFELISVDTNNEVPLMDELIGELATRITERGSSNEFHQLLASLRYYHLRCLWLFGGAHSHEQKTIQERHRLALEVRGEIRESYNHALEMGWSEGFRENFPEWDKKKL